VTQQSAMLSSALAATPGTTPGVTPVSVANQAPSTTREGWEELISQRWSAVMNEKSLSRWNWCAHRSWT